MEKKSARRMSNVYESSNRSKARESNLLSNYFNLPLVNLSRASPTPTSKPLRVTAQLIVSESFGNSQLLESENNTHSQESSILKINEESNSANSRIISKYVANKNKEWSEDVEKHNAYQRSKSIQFAEEEEENQKIKNIKQFRRGSLLKDYGNNIHQQKQKTDSRLNSNRDFSSTVDTPIILKNNKGAQNEFFNWEDVMNYNDNKISLQQAAALLGKPSPVRENEFVFRERKTSNKRQKHQQKLYQKLRILVLFVRAAMRISKPYRQSQKRMLTEHNNLVKLREPHYKFINLYGLRNIKGEHKKFLMMVSNKILHYFEEKKYAQECSQIWSKVGDIDKDTRKTRFCAFSQMFLSNLELLTRVENLPELISHQLNTCLFKTNESTISQFVSKRSRLYSQKVTSLSQNEKILVVAEFFFFQIVAPSFIEIVNEIKNQKAAHKNQNLLYCFGIISMMQMIFTNHFQQMPLITNANVRPIQRIVSVKTDENTGQMEAKLEIVKQLEKDEMQIIFGCFKNDSITQIISEKPKWNDKIEKTFNQIISNIWCHIQI